ncbi:MAG TPA: type IV pilus secretin PilQ [Gammaproteobacteria bacterium]|jgi:type IV pilus assembly protein PilQ|nr:type IV pilus secretin PilQ [Gammaproteobacteria bacterium]
MNTKTYTLHTALLAAALLVAGPAVAADAGHNQLQSINAAKLGGDRVQIALTLSGAPAQAPLSFTVNQPARIALDLPDTRLSLKDRKTDVQAGMVNSIVTAEAGGRSRVVINLTTLVPYTVKTDGNTVYVIVGANAADTAVASANISSFGPQATGTPAAAPESKPAVVAAAPVPVPTPSAPAPAAASPAAQAPASAPQQTVASAPARAAAPSGGNVISNLDFRRGKDGSGEILVTLPNPGIIGNVHDQNGNVAVDFAGAKLPEELVRRMDVTDFATPVQFVDAQNTPTGAQLVIHSAGRFEKLAYQSDDTFSVELKPLTQTAQAQLEAKKSYGGQKISLNFQSIDVRAVLQILADASGKNIVVSDAVNGNITLRLQDVPWDQALDIIMHTKGLATREYGNVLMVGTASEISAQEQAEASAQQSLAQVEPLQSAFIQVNYAKAIDLQALVKGTGESGLLSKRGSVSVDARTNTLLVQDTADNISNIRAMVARLDVAVKQVLIESRVVIANNDFTRDLGARLGYSGSRTTSGSFMTTSGSINGTDSQTSAFIDNQNAINNAINNGQTPPLPIGFTVPALTDRLNVNLPTAPTAGSIAFSVLRGDSIIDLELSALQAEGQGEVVSAPRVLTADQKLAHIEQGVQIPYQQASASGATTTAFKNAVLSLDVTPQITPDSRINMDLEVHKDAVGQNVQSATGGSVPTIDTRDVKTTVLVNNGDTVVLGGVYETTQSIAVTKVPLLGDLPLLGWLFRNTETKNNKNELLIFVTPKILDQSATAAIGQ